MPERVADLLARCFRERPEDRPHDLAEVVDVLRSAWEQSPGAPTRGGSREAVAARPTRSTTAPSRSWTSAAPPRPRRCGAAPWRPRRSTSRPPTTRASPPGSRAAWPTPSCSAAWRSPAPPTPAERGPTSCWAACTWPSARDPRPWPSSSARPLSAAREDLDRDVAAARVGAPPPLRTLRGLRAPWPPSRSRRTGGRSRPASGAEVRLWDAATGQLIRTLSVPDGPVRSLALLPDGRFLVVGVESAPIAVWDLASGRPGRGPGHATPASRRAWRSCPAAASSSPAAPTASCASGTPRADAGSRDGGSRGRRHRGRGGADAPGLRQPRRHGSALGARGRALPRHAAGPRGPRPGGGARRERRPGSSPRARTAPCATGASIRASPSASTARTASRSWPSPSRRTGSASSRAPPTARCAPSRPTASGSASLARLDGAVQALAVAPDGTCWAAHGTTVERPSGPPAARARRRPCAGRPPPPRRRRAPPRSRRGSRRPAARWPRATCSRPCPSPAARAPSRATSARRRPSPCGTTSARGCPRRALQSAWEDARLEGHEDQVLAVAVDRAGARAPHRRPRRDGAAVGSRLAPRRGHPLGPRGGGHRRRLRRRGPRRLRRARPDGPAVGPRRPPGPRRPGGPRGDGHGRGRHARRPARGERELGRHGAPLGPPAPGRPARPRGPRGPRRRRSPLPRRPGRRQRGLGRHGAAVGRGLGTASSGSWRVTRATSRPSPCTPTAARWRRAARTAPCARGTRAPAAPSACSSGHEGEVTGLAFTPDGRFLLSASRDRSVRVWDLRRGETVRTLPHPALVLGLALTPVASALLTACADRCARVLHLDWEPEIPVSPPAATPTARDRRRHREDPRHGGGGRRRPPRPCARTSAARRRWRIPALPRAARAARRIPWGRAPIALALLAAIVVTWLAWRRPAAGLRVSPHMAQAVPKELDLIDLEPYRRTCSPGDYERHLAADALRQPRRPRRRVPRRPGQARASWWTCSTARHSTLPSP